MSHDVSIMVTHEGWASLASGASCARRPWASDVLLTADHNIEFQQNRSALPLAVIVPFPRVTGSSRWEPLLPAVLDALNNLTAQTLLGSASV